uniref:Cation-transporting ATPase n=1 Tax=Panagrellus redivivus TaxID=6233 RepID=A0A7E4UZ81_PANRE
MAIDSLVESVVAYNLRPAYLHLYFAPFFTLHLTWLYIWLVQYGYEELFEWGCIITCVITALQLLSGLFCYWFVSVRCFMACSWVKDPRKAAYVCVDPTPNNGWAELIPLRTTTLADGSKRLWFSFQRVLYTYDDDKKTFGALEFDTNKSFKYYKEHRGFQSDEELKKAILEYGVNEMEMKIPEFIELFIERATAPFFVFQVFCVGLWCLEDMLYYSLFTLFMLVTFEATIVKQQLRNMSEIRNMGNKAYPVYVYRNKRWVKINSNELVCGDVVSVVRNIEDRAIPCDLLLLRGQCIVDESMLTGESVPQMKESIDDVDSDRYFDFVNDSRLHVINGGTKIVQHTPIAKGETSFRPPDGGVLCYVLKTGFSTSQGSLLRTIMFGVKRVTANNLETFAFILFLLIFAIAAAAYLWIKGSEDESRSKFKLFLECSLILTSVIPPELPIELSLAVNNSLIALQKLGVFCTEPFRIPFAGKVNICCFDKTGTLTTDALVVEGIAGLEPANEKGEYPTSKDPHELPAITTQVLAACQSLVKFDEELVGDPLEKACLTWIDWNLTKNDTVIGKKTKLSPLKIIQRFHFSSQLKRMSVIAGYTVPGFPEPKHLALVKGAPEILQNMYENPPADYEEMYRKLALTGARIIALGFRELGSLSHQELRDNKREFYEQKLTFAGFVVIHCPLKPDTKAMIKEIIESNHQVTMITGDNPLTACHVAQVLRFTKKRMPVLILDEHDDEIPKWKSMYGDEEFEVVPCKTKVEIRNFIGANELCVTGPGFEYLSHHHSDFLNAIIAHIRVFARMSPKQKERAVNLMKALGYTTLMCGDGTNDVGALKHANVGVALLSHPYDATKEKKPAENKDAAPKAPVAPVAPTPPAPLPAQHRRGAPRQIDNRLTRHQANLTNAQARLEAMMKQVEEEEAARVIKLGDASIAAPFTSKYTSIQSICHIIKQGRCTLVTTLQMFKILALNALILAYSQSVLYLDGVKFSDTQATIQGLLLAACFLFISRSRPLKTLSKQRPTPNIFNAYTLLTVTSQFAIHFLCLIYVVQESHRIEPRGKVDLQAEFAPNLLNTAVYVMSMGLQVATFAVNYRGRPFMESLWENTPMLYSVIGSGLGVFALAANLMPEINDKFQLVELPDEFRQKLVMCVVGDFGAAFAIDRVLNYVLGDMRA